MIPTMVFFLALIFKLAYNVPRLCFSGVELKPSNYKYRINNRLSNCAIANYPESSH